jgi:hypothetical protein
MKKVNKFYENFSTKNDFKMVYCKDCFELKEESHFNLNLNS